MALTGTLLAQTQKSQPMQDWISGKQKGEKGELAIIQSFEPLPVFKNNNCTETEFTCHDIFQGFVPPDCEHQGF